MSQGSVALPLREGQLLGKQTELPHVRRSLFHKSSSDVFPLLCLVFDVEDIPSYMPESKEKSSHSVRLCKVMVVDYLEVLSSCEVPLGGAKERNAYRNNCQQTTKTE